MQFTIQVRNDDIQAIMDFYISKVQSINSKIVELQKELSDINTIIVNLQKAAETGKIRPDDIVPSESEVYLSTWSWTKRISFAIEKMGAPCTSREVFDVLLKYQPALAVSKKKSLAIISATLSSRSGSYESKLDFIKVSTQWGENKYDVWRERIIQKEEMKKSGNVISGIPKRDDDLPF